MNTRQTDQDLDRLLLACEDGILEMSGREALAEAGESAADAAAIVGRLLARQSSDTGSALPPRRPARRARMPRNARSRQQMLDRLVESRQGLPERVRVAFMSGELDDSEIAALLQDLLLDPETPDAE